MHQDLSIRKTHGYIGTWKHLDEHEYIGRLYEEATKTRDLNEGAEEPDYCEPIETTIFARVELEDINTPREVVLSALTDHYSAHGCAHEHDCCGCRSYSASAVHIGGQHYKITVHSSRNF